MGAVKKPHLNPERLRKIRERHGITQVRWAHLLGMRHQQMVQRWEAGVTSPSAAASQSILFLDKILTALDHPKLPLEIRIGFNEIIGDARWVSPTTSVPAGTTRKIT